MIKARMLTAIFLIGTLWLPSVLSSVCVSQDSVFPHIGALDCESYFSCHDFVPHLHDCPQGYQFHYANLQCQPSGQVLCQVQRENFQKLYGAGGIPHAGIDYASADGIFDPFIPPPMGFIDPLAAIDGSLGLPSTDGSLGLPFPDGIIPSPFATGPLLQSPPIGFLPRASMFPSLPAIDMSISVLARDLMEMLGPIAQSGSNQVPTLSISSPFAGNGISNSGFNTLTGYGNTGMQSNIPEYYPDPFFGNYPTNPLPVFSTIDSIPRSGYIPGLTGPTTGFNNAFQGVPLPIFPLTNVQQSGYTPGIVNQYSPNTMTTSYPGISTSVNSIPRSGYIPGFTDTTTVGVPHPIFMNTNNIPTSGFNNAFQGVPLPTFPLTNVQQSGYTPGIVNQYSPNTMTTSFPGISTSVNSIPRSGYIPGFTDTTTVGVPHPIFMNTNNIPTSGFNNAFQGVPLPTFPLTNVQQSGYTPGIVNQYSPNTMSTSFPGISTNVPSFGVIGSLFPINLQRLGLDSTGQTSLGQGGLGLNGMTGMNGLSFPQQSGGFAGFTGTQSMSGGSGLFNGFPAFGNFLNFTFPLFGSSGNAGFGGSGLGTPSYQSQLSGTNFPLNFGINFPVGSTTANSPFPSGFTNTQFGSTFTSPPMPVWNVNTNQAAGTPLNTAPYPVNVNNPSGSFVPRNGFPSGTFLGSTALGSNPPTPLGFGNTGVSTTFTNQGSGYIPNGFNQANTVPTPLGFSNTGVSTTFTNQESGYIPNGFNQANTVPIPLGFSNTGVSTTFANQGSGYIPNGFNQANTVPTPLGFTNNPPGLANLPSNVNIGGYTPQTSVGSNSPSGFWLGNSGGYFPPYPLTNAGSNISPSASNVPSSFGNGYGPVPLGFASTNYGGSVPNTVGYQIPSTGSSSNNAYTPNVVGYQPNTSGSTNNAYTPNTYSYVPNTSGYVPNTSGSLPNISGYSPNKSGYIPNTSGYVPNTSGYIPNTSGYVPNTSGYTPNTSGYVPNTSGYTPNTSGYVPNTSGYTPNTSGYVPNTSGYTPNTSGYVPNTSGYIPNTSGYVPNTSGYVPPSTGYVPSSNINPFTSNSNRSGSVILGGFPGSSYNSNFYNPNSLGFTSNTGTGQLYVPSYGSNSLSSSGTNTGYAPDYASNDHSNTASSSTGFGVVYPSNSGSVAKSGGFQGFELGTLTSGSDSGNHSKDRDFRSTSNDTTIANVASTSGISATVMNGNGTVSVSAG